MSIKTYREGESPRSQKQGKNYKEHKLPCTVYSPEGGCGCVCVCVCVCVRVRVRVRVRVHMRAGYAGTFIYSLHSLLPLSPPSGNLIQSDFTLTRALKKFKSKPVMAASQPQPNPEESTAVVSSGTEGQPLQSVGRQRTGTESSKESNTEL